MNLALSSGGAPNSFSVKTLNLKKKKHNNNQKPQSI